MDTLSLQSFAVACTTEDGKFGEGKREFLQEAQDETELGYGNEGGGEIQGIKNAAAKN